MWEGSCPKHLARSLGNEGRENASTCRLGVWALNAVGLRPRAARWATTARALTIPFDEAVQIHPEFVGMPAKGWPGASLSLSAHLH